MDVKVELGKSENANTQHKAELKTEAMNWVKQVEEMIMKSETKVLATMNRFSDVESQGQKHSKPEEPKTDKR